MKVFSILTMLIMVSSVGLLPALGDSPNLRETLYRSGYDTYQIKFSDRDYQLKYKFDSENTLDKIHFDVDSNSMIFSISPQMKDELLVEIPLEFLLNVIQNCEHTGWFVLIDGEEKFPTITETSSTRILSIPVSENDEEIEIISSYVGMIHLKNCLEQHHFNSLKLQLSFGANNEEIQCPNNLQLVFKSTNNFPACVNSSSVEKLLTRNWTSQSSTSQVNFYTDKTEYEIGEPITIVMKNESTKMFLTPSIPIGFTVVNENGDWVCTWIGDEAIGNFHLQQSITKTWGQKYCEKSTSIESGTQVPSGVYTIIGNHFIDHPKPVPRLEIKIDE